jgi:hypothetical protein
MDENEIRKKKKTVKSKKKEKKIHGKFRLSRNGEKSGEETVTISSFLIIDPHIRFQDRSSILLLEILWK